MDNESRYGVERSLDGDRPGSVLPLRRRETDSYLGLGVIAKFRWSTCQRNLDLAESKVNRLVINDASRALGDTATQDFDA